MICSLVGSGNIDKAAIFNVEGTSVWASTTGFTVSFRNLYKRHSNQAHHDVCASTAVEDHYAASRQKIQRSPPLM